MSELTDAIRLALVERFGVGPGRAEDEEFSEVVINEIMLCLGPVVRESRCPARWAEYNQCVRPLGHLESHLTERGFDWS